jgi:hypothetical protein
LPSACLRFSIQPLRDLWPPKPVLLPVRSRRTTPARVSAVSTSIACLSNRTSSGLSSQKTNDGPHDLHKPVETVQLRCP